MLEIVIEDSKGVRAVVTGAVIEHNLHTQQIGLRNEKTGTLLVLDGLLAEEMHFEYEQEPYVAWNSDPKEILSAPDVKQVIRAKIQVLPAQKLLDHFNVEIQFPTKPPINLDMVYEGPAQTNQSTNAQLVDRLAELIPGMDEAVRHPAEECPRGWREGALDTVRGMVIHLNDTHEWTYQQIAEWLDTLDIDLSVRERAAEARRREVLAAKAAFYAAVPVKFFPGTDKADLGPEWQDVGYIEEDTFFHQQVGEASNYFTQGKTIGTTEGCMTVNFDGVNEQLLKILAGETLPHKPPTTNTDDIKDALVELYYAGPTTKKKED